MSGGVHFDSPSFFESIAPQRKLSQRLVRTRSLGSLSKLNPFSSPTVEKTNQLPQDNIKPSSLEPKPHRVRFADETDHPAESTNRVGQEIILHHNDPTLKHLETFQEIFGVKVDGKITNSNQIKTIYLRMAHFAEASGATPDEMVKNVRRGLEVAKDIASSDFKSNTKTYSGHDLAALDWFLRSQHAKLGQLYLKGTMKMPDPDHHIAQFIHQVEGSNRGVASGAYDRGSSHCPEESEGILKSVIPCENGKYICFSEEKEQELKKQGKQKIGWKEVGIGIDTADFDASKERFITPGKNSRTYLFMLFKEQETPVVLIKAESNPVGGFVDSIKHGAQLYKKFVPPDENVPYPDLKEDKLPPHILVLLKDVKILSGSKGSELRKSFDALEKTTQLQNNYALPQLKAHMQNQLKSEKLEKGQKEKIQKLMDGIDEVFKKADALQENSQYKLKPRSREVILPTLKEMLNNQVPFVEEKKPKPLT